MPPSAPNSTPAWCERHHRSLLVALLAVSFALRVWLASTGGQGYWPDEMRYSSASREAAWQFAHGAPREAWLALIGTADHLLFKIAGVPVAFWELRHGNNGVLVASWFGFFSVLSIGMVFAIARTAGAGERESLLAAFFLAGASSLFYYSRHFFPYDLSLFFCLLATWLALGRAVWWRSALAGLCAGLGFLSYNGYWLLGGVVLVFHVLSGKSWRRMFVRAALAGAGLLAPIVAAVEAARALDRDLIASFQEFSRTITQGDFGRGWIVVWQYLWDTEGVGLVIWLTLIGAGLWSGRAAPARRLLLWVGAVAALYLGLVMGADGWRTFVVYGRTARVLVPFLCLAAAAGTEALASRWTRRWAWVALIAATTAGAGWHMAAALRTVFPQDFLRLAVARAQAARTESPALLRVLNADRLGEGHVMSEPRPHDVLLRCAHPLSFAPYRYEGLDEERRRRFATEDIAMQLIAVPSVSLPDIGGGYPGPLLLRLKFPAEPMAPGLSEPVLTSGSAGKANFIYVQYADANHLRFGYDCWGRGGMLGVPIVIDLAREHVVVLSSGAQLPPGDQRPAELGPMTWSRLQNSVLVAVDGEIALAGSVATNPAEARSIFGGANFAGGSTAREGFTGEIRGIDRARWQEVLQRLPEDRLTAAEATERLTLASPGPDWTGYCGPLRIRVRLPLGIVGQAEPLVVSGKTGAGDFVFVRYLSDGRVTFGFDHWGVGGPESAPVALAESRRAIIVVSHGGLMPPREARLYAQSPELMALLDSVVIAVDGRPILVASVKPYPTALENITVGRNTIGGSTTTAQFGGEIFALISEPVEELLKMRNSAGGR